MNWDIFHQCGKDLCPIIRTYVVFFQNICVMGWGFGSIITIMQ